MKNSEQKLKILLDNSVSAIIFLKPDGSIFEVNKAAENIFGYTQQELLLISIKDILDETHENFSTLFLDFDKKPKLELVLTGVRKNLQKFPIEINTSSYIDDGKLCILATIKDISQTKNTINEIDLIIDNTQESFVFLDTSLRIVSYNTQFKNLFYQHIGYTLKKGVSIINYAPPEKQAKLALIYSDVLKGITKKRHLSFPTLEGKTKHFSIIYLPTKDENEAISGVFVSAIDITEEIENQISIKETKAELDKIMDFSIDIICTIDKEDKFVKVSPACNKVLGYTPEELIGKKYTQHLFPEDLKKTQLLTAEIKAGHDKTNFQNRYIKKDGTLVSILWSIKWDEVEELMICVAKDATEKVAQETRLIESEKLYRNLFKNNPAPMFIFDFETLQIIDCNEETVLKYGYTKEEFLQLTIKDIRPTEDIEIIEKIVENEDTYGQIHKRIWRHKKKNGEIMFMDISGHMITYNERRMSLVMLIDVTDKLKVEEQKEFEKRDKEALINSTEDLIWSVSKNFELIAANRAFIQSLEKRTGFTIKVGQNLLMRDVYPTDYLVYWEKCYKKALLGESFKEEIKINQHLDEEEKWYIISFNPIFKEEEVVGIACYSRNITQNKKFETDLIISEEKYRLMFYNSPLPKWIYDIETLKIVDVNDTAIYHYGYSKEEFLSFTIKDIRPQEDFTRLEKKLNEAQSKDGIYHSGVFRHLKKNGQIILVEVSGHSITFQGRECRIVLCNDVTTRERNLQSLKEKEAQLRSAQHIAKLGYWQLNLQTNNLFWSKEVYSIWGINEIKKPNFQMFVSYIHPEDLDDFMAEQISVLNGEKEMSIEHRIILKDGSIKWVHERAKLLKNNLGKAISLDGTVQDITERKNAEENLKESIQRYENVTKATSDAIWDWDLVNNIIYRAEGFKNFGFDLKKLNSPDTNWDNYIHPDDRVETVKSINEVIKSNEIYWNHEYRIINPNGKNFYVNDKAYLVRDENNNATRIIGALKDISESKHHQNIENLEREILELNAIGTIPIQEIIKKYLLGIEKLHSKMICSMQIRKGKQLFNLAAPSLPDNFLKAINGKQIEDNNGSCGTAAFLKKKIVVKNISTDIKWVKYKEIAADNGLKSCWSIPIFSSDGKVLATFGIYYSEIKEPTLLEENTIERAGHILQIILQSYLKENALKESNVRYENVTKATSDAIWDWDMVSNKIFWGETFNHLFGKINQETLSDAEKLKTRLHADEVNDVLQSASIAIKSKALNWSYEHQFLKSDGNFAHVSNKAFIIRDEKGRAIRVIGAMQDITETRKIEESRRKSNERFELIGKAANDAIWEWDFVANNGWANLVHQEMFGLTLEDNVPEREEWINRLHPTERESILKSFQEAVDLKKDIFYAEYQFKTQDNNWISISDRTYIEYNASGNIVRKIGSMSNITQRKKEEQQLRLMSSVVTNTNEAVIITEAVQNQDQESRIIYVNEAFTKMTGYEVHEIVGKTPKILQGPKSDPHQLSILKNAVKNVESCEITIINYKKNGSEFWVNLTVSPVFNTEERLTHWISVERDVTVQKNAELQNELIADISIVFNEPIKLHETLDKTLRLITDLFDFCYAEAWMTSNDKKNVTKISTHTVTENMNLFKEETNYIESFVFGDGLAGIAAETKEIQIWTDLSHQKNFKRSTAAEKHGLKTIMALPLLYNGEVIGVLTFGLHHEVIETSKYLLFFKTLNTYLSPEIRRKQLELELNQLFNFAPDFIAILGIDGYFKRINPAACELLGYTEAELCSSPFTDFIHPDDVEKSIQEAKNLVTDKNTYYFENRFITKSGKIIWLAWNAIYSQEENNIYAVAKNFTDKKELEDLLQKANELAKIGGWEYDVEKNSLFWSAITRNIHELPDDYSPELQVGKTFYKKGKSRNAISRYIKNAITTGKYWDDEFQIITAKGNERWIRVIGEAEFINGKCKRIYGSFQDIDDRKKADEKIKSSEARQKLIMNAALDAIICIDKEGLITFWNPQAEEIFGWSAFEVNGKQLSNIIIPQVHRASHDNGIKNYLKTGKGRALNVLLQLSAVNRDGIEFPIELTVLPIQQDGEEFFCAFIRDISQRKTYETQLIELNESLKRQKAALVVSNHELEQFAYIASHDLQEPLRMVTSFLTLLNKKYSNNLDETANNYIHFAVDGAKRMRQLILDLLEYSRIGKDLENTEFIDLNTLIEEIKMLYQQKIDEINAVIIIDESLPKIKYHKSPLLQLFQNLISNALKYSRNDVVTTIKISCVSVKDNWQFVVEDNGIGIEEAYYDKIFVIFQRLHNKDEYSGTGMGLALTKKIVESLKGEIWVESTINVGSKFYFTIPKNIV